MPGQPVLRAPSSSLGIEDGVAIDCEMVQVHPGRHAVARVAVVSYREEVLLDEWVHVPASEVADYVTRISGVREEHLVSARSFEAVQAEVRQLIFGRTLIGHGLRADLKALQLAHPPANIIDTESLDWGSRRRNLGSLCREVLGQDIQRGSHSPVLDAMGSVRLLKAHRARGGPPPPRIEIIQWIGAPLGVLASPPPPPAALSASAYQAVPEGSDPPPPQLTLPWHVDHIAPLLCWFKGVSSSPGSALAFSASLSKTERGMVHKKAQALRLPTLSLGTEPDRYISVLTGGSPDQNGPPRTRPVELVYLWARNGEEAAEAAAGYSLGELAERAHTGNLGPEVRALLERARGVTASVYGEGDTAGGGGRKGGDTGTGAYRTGGVPNGCGCDGCEGTGAGGRSLCRGSGVEVVAPAGGRGAPGIQRRQTALDVVVGRVEAARAQRRFRCLTELRRGGI